MHAKARRFESYFTCVAIIAGGSCVSALDPEPRIPILLASGLTACLPRKWLEAGERLVIVQYDLLEIVQLAAQQWDLPRSACKHLQPVDMAGLRTRGEEGSFKFFLRFANQEW